MNIILIFIRSLLNSKRPRMEVVSLFNEQIFPKYCCLRPNFLCFTYLITYNFFYLGVNDKLWKQWKKECCNSYVAKNWQSLPTAEIAKLCPNGQNEKSMHYLKDIKVDARSISDTIDEMNHAVNVFPFQINSLAQDIKNQQRTMSLRMDRMEASILRMEQILTKNMTDDQSPLPPLAKKMKLVSQFRII